MLFFTYDKCNVFFFSLSLSLSSALCLHETPLTSFHVSNQLVPKIHLPTTTGDNLPLPLTKNHPKTPTNTKTSTKLKTRLPPKTTECHFHALPSSIPTLPTTIAQGNTQKTLLTRDWYKYQRGRVASNIVANCVDAA